MSIFGNLFNRNPAKPGPVTGKGLPSAGVVYTIPRLLASTSTLSLANGTDTNLTLVNGNQISAAVAIPNGQVQRAIVRESLAYSAVEYPIAFTGVQNLITSGVIAQVGDSRAAGQGAAYKYIDKLSFPSGVTIANGFSISGHTVGVFGSTPGLSGGIDIATDVPNGISSLYQSGKANVVLITRGLNDTRYFGTSPATIYDNMKQYAAFYRAQGFRPIFMTECYYTDVSGTQLTNAQNDITALNNLIVANADSNPNRRADGIIDLRSTAIGSMTAPDNTTYYSDKVHGTTAWHDIVAAAAKPVINDVLAMTALVPNVIVPSAPVLSAIAGSGSNAGKIILSWSDNANNGPAIINHELWQGTASGNETLVGSIAASGPVSVTANLTPNVPAFFKIKARNAYQAISGFSNEVSATPVPVAGTTIVDAPFTVSADTQIANYKDNLGNSFAAMPMGGGLVTGGVFYPDATVASTSNATLGGTGQYAQRIPTSNNYTVTWVSKFTTISHFLIGMSANGASFISININQNGTFALQVFDSSYQNARKDVAFNDTYGKPTAADWHTLVATVTQGTNKVDIVVTIDGTEILRGSETGAVQSPGYIGTRTLNRMLLDSMTVVQN